MGVDEYPEILLARKIIAKYQITIPFDLAPIVKDYATLLYKAIPIRGVDGVSLNLKTPGKKPTVIVNSDLPKKRQLFTLAHELGHLIIPWHLGTIVDDIFADSYNNFVYFNLEQEANRFAAELLMPKEWILSKVQNSTLQLAYLHSEIARESGVSDHAAVIRLIKYLPKNIVYVAVNSGIVDHTAKTEKTNAHLQDVKSSFDENFYKYVKNYSKFISGTRCYHWYELENSIEIDSQDERSWREILDIIVNDIKPEEGNEKFKKRINGIIAYAHGLAKREDDYSLGSIISACIHRLERKGLEKLISHPQFKSFIKNRAIDFVK